MKFILVTLICIASSLFSKEYKHDLAICTIFKDDTRYLPEWIEFHFKQGVKHIFLYENNSPDDFKMILETYVNEGKVEIIPWHFEPESLSAWNHIQCSAYMDCIEKNRKICKWIAFLDTDEFLFSPSKNTLPKILKDYSQFPAVSVNWMLYGNGFVDALLPGEKMTDKLLHRCNQYIDVNKHVKTIVQPKFVKSCDNPHYFHYFFEMFAVTENKEFIEGPFTKFVSVEILRINHYWQRDKEFFENIFIPRKKKWGWTIDKIESIRNIYNDVYDDVLSNSSS